MFCTFFTTHQPTGKFYIGKGKTLAVQTGKYKGSGRILLDAFKKYPAKQWDCDVLWEFEDEDEAYSDEAGIVDEELLKDPLCLNLVPGGRGHKPKPEDGLAISRAKKGKKWNKAEPHYNTGRTPWNKGVPMPEEVRAKLRVERTPEQCINIGLAQMGPRTEAQLSQLGRMHQTNVGLHWFNDGTNETKYRECPNGWVPGRLFKPRKRSRT